MGILRLYELPREVQKLIGRSGGILPPKKLRILQPPRSVLRPYNNNNNNFRETHQIEVYRSVEVKIKEDTTIIQ